MAFVLFFLPGHSDRQSHKVIKNARSFYTASDKKIQTNEGQRKSNSFPLYSTIINDNTVLLLLQ